MLPHASVTARVFRRRRATYPCLGLDVELPGKLDASLPAEVDRPARQFLGALELRMPDANDPALRCQVGDRRLALCAGLREMRRLGYVDVRDHPVVDIATEDDYAGLVE